MKIDYDQSAHPYARFRKINPRTLERLLAVAALTGKSRVLEIGSGTGNYITAISELTRCECHGLDPSAGMQAQAQARNQTVVSSWSRNPSRGCTFPKRSAIIALRCSGGRVDR